MASSDVIQFTKTSLILIVNDQQGGGQPAQHAESRLDHRIWQAVRGLGLLHCRAEVILVFNGDTHWNDEQTRRIREATTYRPFPKIYPCLKQAIQAAKYPLIAITDPDTRFDREVWELLRVRSNQLGVQTAFYSSANGPKSSSRTHTLKRLQLSISGLITNTILGTRKSELRHGITMLNRDALTDCCGEANAQVDPLETMLEEMQPQQTLASSTQLIALARLSGIEVSQTDLGVSTAPTGSKTALPPSSKTIRRTLASSLRFWWNTMMFPRHPVELKQQLGQSNPRKVGWPKQLAIVAVLMLIASFCLFHSLGFALFEPDEARNAQLALNALESGDWLSLELNQEPYWDKPPFQIWAIASSYQMFGVNQWSTRLPGAFAALLTILMTIVIGKRLVGFRAAAIGALLLILTAGFLFTGRYVTMDSALTTTTTATLMLGFLAIRDRFSKSLAVAAGIACGIGVLTKGPVAIALCFPPLIAASWLLAKQPQQSKLRNRWLWFAIPTCLISAPWFIATSLVHPDFLTYFFWQHHIVRFTAAFNHRGPFWFYAVGIFVFMFPASYLIPSAARFLTSRKPENRLWRTREHGFLFLSVVWIMVFFTVAESKLPTYIVPTFPLICLLMGVLVERKLLNRKNLLPGRKAVAGQPLTKSRRSFLDGLPRRAPLELVFWIATGSIVLLTLLPSASASLGWMIASAVLVGLLSTLAVRKRSKPKLAWTCFGLLALFTVSMIVHRIVPASAQNRSIHIAAEKLKKAQGFENAPLVFFGREPYGSTLVHDPADVKFFGLTQTRKMVDFLTANPTAIIVAPAEQMKALRGDLPWTIRLDQCPKARHLYTSQINQAVAAKPTDDATAIR